MLGLSTKTDEQLMSLIGQGEHSAFDILFARMSPFVFRACVAILRDQQEAEDAMQDSFVKLWNNAGKWNGDASPKTWLLTIARNRCLDVIRKHKNDSKKQQDYYEDHLTQPYYESHAGEAKLEQHDKKKMFQQALFILPERQREAITHVYFNELRNSEAADLMGLNAGAFDSLLARARRGVAKFIEEGNNWDV